jgi:hypothetical protein
LGDDARDGQLRVPIVPEEHHWIEERIAAHVETIARLEAADISAAKL